MGIKNVYTTAYHPQTNAHAERFNRYLAAALSLYVNPSQRDWDLYLPAAIMAYRSSVHDVTKFSPYYLLYGRIPRLPYDVALDEPSSPSDDWDDYNKKHHELLTTAWNAVENWDARQRVRAKLYYDKLQKAVEYPIGSLVLVYTPILKRQKSKKLLIRWTGPHKVLTKLSDLVYKVQHLAGTQRVQTVHVQRLRRYEPWAEYLHNSDIDLSRIDQLGEATVKEWEKVVYDDETLEHINDLPVSDVQELPDDGGIDQKVRDTNMFDSEVLTTHERFTIDAPMDTMEHPHVLPNPSVSKPSVTTPKLSGSSPRRSKRKRPGPGFYSDFPLMQLSSVRRCRRPLSWTPLS
jgi:hypothetical protein